MRDRGRVSGLTRSLSSTRHSHPPGTHISVTEQRNMAFLYIWAMPNGAVIAGHWFIFN